MRLGATSSSGHHICRRCPHLTQHCLRVRPGTNLRQCASLKRHPSACILLRLSIYVSSWSPRHGAIYSYSRSTRNQCGNSSPIVVIVLHYCIVSLTSSFLSIYPYRRSCRRSCSPRHRAIYPGSHCFFRSTRNKSKLGDCLPVLAIVLHDCILQRAVFFFCPFTHTCDRLVAIPRHRAILYNTVVSFDPEPAQLCFITASAYSLLLLSIYP
jgi:hypothetical protein